MPLPHLCLLLPHFLPSVQPFFTHTHTRTKMAMEVLGSGGAAAECCAKTPELHVLAVDDSYVDRKVVERLLKISACKVTAVESGRRALQYLGLDGEDNGSVDFDGVKVNLILTDYSMPGMTGYELLKKIKGSSVLKQIPVVIMSSENIVTRIDRCLEEGAEEFLMKPVKLSDVKRIKDFMLRSDEEDDKKRVNLKRKLPEEEPLPTVQPPPSQSSTASDIPAPDSPVKRPRLQETDGDL